MARRGRNTSTNTLAAPSGCRTTTSSRCQMSPPFANAPTRAVKPAKSACITASTVTDIRKLVMEHDTSRRGARPLNRAVDAHRYASLTLHTLERDRADP